jgi:hypothetical protein
MYEWDKGEEMNPMEYVSNNGAKVSIFFFFTLAELYSGLKNIVVMKFPNS